MFSVNYLDLNSCACLGVFILLIVGDSKVVSLLASL